MLGVSNLHLLHLLGVFVFLLGLGQLQLLVLPIPLVQVVSLVFLHQRDRLLKRVLLAAKLRLHFVRFFLHVRAQGFLLFAPVLHQLFVDEHDLGERIFNFGVV